MKGVAYKNKEGKYLKVEYLGDGEYELYLIGQVDSECVFKKNWPLTEILSYCDGVYDENGEYISDKLTETDFTTEEVEVRIKKR